MKIVPLGTAGFFPTYGKETMSVLVVDGEIGLLFDAGTGTKRLFEPAVRDVLKEVDELHVIFSHFHHDHTSGFTWLLRLWSSKALHIHVPGRLFVECDGEAAIRELSSLPFFAAPLETWGNVRSIETFGAERLRIANFEIHTIKQEHAGGSVGFRVGGFAYITDTEPAESHVKFLQGCELVFMDTMMDSRDFAEAKRANPGPGQHGSSESNGDVAASAQIGRLGLVHVDPEYDPERVKGLLAEAAARVQHAFLPREGMIYEVPR